MRGKINLGNDKKWKISFGARSLITSQLLDLDHCGQKFCHGDSYEFYGKKDFFCLWSLVWEPFKMDDASNENPFPLFLFPIWKILSERN